MNRAQSGSPSMMIFVVALVLIVGFIGVTAVGDTLEKRQVEQENRALEVYGEEDYVTVSSNACWDSCAMTVTTREQQKQDLLRGLKHYNGWVNEFKLSQWTPGMTVDEPLSELAKRDDVERRPSEGWFSVSDYYRYAGDQPPPEPLSDEEVTTRVHNRLYLTGTYMTAEEIAADLPVSELRVELALDRLEERGAVDSGYASRGHFPSRETKYIDTRHGTLPDTWWYRPGLFGVMVVILFAAIALGFIQRWRHQPSPE